MDNYLDLFTNLESRESIFIWTVLLVAFLLGFFIALLLRAARIRRLKKELADAQRQKQEADTLLASAQTQLQERNAELQAESREKVELIERLEQLENEKKQHFNEIYQLNQQIEELQSTTRTYVTTIDDLNDQVIGLKTQNEQLREAQTEAEGSIQALSAAPAPTVDQGEYQALQSRLNRFEQSLQRLETENEQLRTDLKDIKATPAVRTVAEVPATEEKPKITTDKKVLHQKIIVDDREHDDLTHIEGIGPFLEKKLNSIGVFRFEDIAAWTPERVAEVTEQIEYFPGRIDKDQWVDQAAKLAANPPAPKVEPDSEPEPEPEPAPEGKKEVKSKKKKKGKNTPSNLKIIEGIGPKIEEILKNGGITDWSGLAAADPGRLRELLEEAGDQYRMHNPYTWPLQARLAAADRWDELKEYQSELKGGKEVE